MKIVELIAENVKRLHAITIRPDGSLVEVAGRNGQGKSSVLDAIWWALAGADNIQRVPIRKGATEARIRLDLGELVVTRTFKHREDGEVTTSLRVEAADGARYPSPQKVLDGLLGALAFDPLAFSRLAPQAQFDMLRQFVPGVDFEAIEKANRADFDKRRDLNRDAKARRSQADGIALQVDAPDARIDDAALVEEMERAGQANADLEARRARREQAERDVGRQNREAADLEIRSAAMMKEARALAYEAEKLRSAAEETDKKLAAAADLPAPTDTTDLKARIAAAREANAAFDRAERDRAEKGRLTAEAEDLDAKAKALTEAMAARTASKAAAIAAAKMPVAGLTLGDDEVLLAGIPFDQASSAEQIRASVSIAMASNPKLRVLRVMEGSLLDEEGMRILAEMAEAADAQVFVERVGQGGPSAIVIEDGMVVGAAESAS